MARVLVGARSGKSRIAQELAEAEAGPLCFVATPYGFDAGMADRIARHRADRDPRWHLFEAPLDLPQVLASEQTRSCPAPVDCLTAWLGNLMHNEHDVVRAIDEMIAVLEQPRQHTLHLVSNEVGQGIVPYDPMARAFRDHAGRLNQRVAGAAKRVLFVTAGIPQTLRLRRSIGHEERRCAPSTSGRRLSVISDVRLGQSQ